MVQATWAPDPVVHHFCAHVATLANKQAVLYLLLGAIIVWEGSTTAERRHWGVRCPNISSHRRPITMTVTLTWPGSGRCHYQQTWGQEQTVSTHSHSTVNENIEGRTLLCCWSLTVDHPGRIFTEEMVTFPSTWKMGSWVSLRRFGVP